MNTDDIILTVEDFGGSYDRYFACKKSIESAVKGLVNTTFFFPSKSNEVFDLRLANTYNALTHIKFE